MKNIKKRTGYTLVEAFVIVLVIGILMAIAIPNFIRARDTSRKREAAALAVMPKYLANLQAHADQFVLPNRTFTIWAVDAGYGNGWVVHMNDNANHYGELFVPYRLKEQMDSYYVTGAKLSFLRTKPANEPTVRNYASYSVLDYLQPMRLDSK